MIEFNWSKRKAKIRRLVKEWAESVIVDWGSAKDIRRAWLTMMGLDAEEVDRDIKLFPPQSIEAELEQYEAIKKIKELNEQQKAH